jgi:polyhydroxyalkanoate synthesis regulator phasin
MRARYDELVAEGTLRPDANQAVVVDWLNTYQQQLLDTQERQVEYKRDYARIADMGTKAKPVQRQGGLLFDHLKETG